jgi:hypothetical protein
VAQHQEHLVDHFLLWGIRAEYVDLGGAAELLFAASLWLFLVIRAIRPR